MDLITGTVWYIIVSVFLLLGKNAQLYGLLFTAFYWWWINKKIYMPGDFTIPIIVIILYLILWLAVMISIYGFWFTITIVLISSIIIGVIYLIIKKIK